MVGGDFGAAITETGSTANTVLDSVEDGIDQAKAAATNVLLEALPQDAQTAVRDAWQAVSTAGAAGSCFASVAKNVRRGAFLGKVGMVGGFVYGVAAKWDACKTAVTAAVDATGQILDTATASKSTFVCATGTWAVQSEQVRPPVCQGGRSNRAGVSSSLLSFSPPNRWLTVLPARPPAGMC